MSISAVSLPPVYQSPQTQSPQKAVAQGHAPVAPAGGGDSDGDNDGSGGVNMKA